MRFMVIDTETNALPKYNLPADAPGQARLAELCMMLLRPDKTVEEVYHAYVRPDGWDIEPDAFAVNGLTLDKLMADGKPAAEVVAVYAHAIREGYHVVAHNARHDIKVMRGELRLAGMDDLFMLTKNTCTMQSAMGHVVKEGGRKGFPKLEDCCAHFGIPKEPKPHGARAGAEACYQVFLKLDALGAMKAPDIHRATAGTAAGEAHGLGPAKPKRQRGAPKVTTAEELPAALKASVSARDEIPS